MNLEFDSNIDPKIDILLPCYNSSETLSRTIESIRAQTFKNFRLILVDNNSSDNSVQIFEDFHDNRFEINIHSETVSLGANFNRCLKFVKSEYFCIMHADDEYQDNYLEEMYTAFQSNPEITLAFCNADIIDETSTKRFSIKNTLKKIASPSKNTEYFGSKGLLWISEYNKIIAPSVMYRRSVITTIGEFHTELKFTLDWEYYFRIFKSGGKVLHVNKVLFNYRVHSKQQTAELIISMAKYNEMYALLNLMHNYINEKYDIYISNKYKYFKYATIFDLTNDLIGLSFANAVKKFQFLKTLY